MGSLQHRKALYLWTDKSGNELKREVVTAFKGKAWVTLNWKNSCKNINSLHRCKSYNMYCLLVSNFIFIQTHFLKLNVLVETKSLTYLKILRDASLNSKDRDVEGSWRHQRRRGGSLRQNGLATICNVTKILSWQKIKHFALFVVVHIH